MTPPAGPSPDVARLLASYPHVSHCPACLEYAEAYLRQHSRRQVLPAVLDHHDSAHGHDRLGGLAASF